MNLNKSVRRTFAAAALVGSVAGMVGTTGAAHADTAASSAITSPVVSAVAPSAPLSVTALGGNQQVFLSWKAPANDGGAPVTSYTVQWAATARGPWNFFAPAYNTSFIASSAYFYNGTPYYFRILANTSAGTSVPSAVVSAVPRTVPGKVPSCQAWQSSPGSKWIVVKWQAPYTDGGAPITHYEVTIYKNGVWYTAHTVPNQVNLVDALPVASYGQYEYRVKALNNAGYGAACGTGITVY